MTDIRPQPGPQEAFLSSSADIVIYGGAAGGGKSWALLMEPLRHIDNPDFGAVIFRRESTQITNEGGLWDTSMRLYPSVGGDPKVSPKLMYKWASGARVTFAHLQYEKDALSWQGAQVPLTCFDELTHFTRTQFFYLMSRGRSESGVKPYIRATTNPDSESWVADFIGWWIDQETGYAIAERSGVIRYFVRIDDEIIWGDSKEELIERFALGEHDIKSMTFIPAKLTDNQILLEKDPGYMANLKALGRVERARLLDGNWKIKPSSGMYFRRHEVTMLPVAPTDLTAICRGWDLAASEPNEQNPNPDWTAGVKIGRRSSGKFVVLDVVRDRKRAGEVRKMVQGAAKSDGTACRIKLPQDPGQAGKEQATSYVFELSGYNVRARTMTGDKVTRAEPFSAQWQQGNVEVVQAPWNDAFFAELEAFVSTGAKDDQVDAASDAFEGVRATSTGFASRGTRVFGGSTQ